MPSAAIPIFINGRFLTQKVTGVQRFAREIVLALDRVLAGQENAPSFTLVVPEGTPALPGLSHIAFLPFGKRRGHVWEQIDLRRATQGGVLINLGSSGPLLRKYQLTVIHDAAVYRYPQNYSLTYSLAHRMLGRILVRTSRLGTVSEFSRGELSELLHVNAGDVSIIPNGHEHILSVMPEDEILNRLSLRERPYFLFVGTTAPNKNLSRAVAAFAALNREDVAFVIVGGSEKSVYRSGIGALPPNALLPGRLTDGEIVSLYRNAAALVFPSLYEGFGIPPLEAMTLGCPVLASRILPVEEVCGDAALYFDPLNPAEITEGMKKILGSQNLRADLIAKGRARFSLFSWEVSAQKLLSIILRGSERP